MDEFERKMREGLDEMISSTITEGQLEMFKQYVEILLHWNEFMNLTRITEINEIISEHFLDSLSIADMSVVKDARRIMDVGTGAGLPGIPLKIYYPKKELTLLDSQKKKVEFLNEVVASLNLENVDTIHGRAEDIAREKVHRETYDLVVSRAVAPLPVLLEYAMPFVKVGGSFIAYKGPKAYKEVEEAQNALDVLGAQVHEIKDIKVPYSSKTHMLLMIGKVAKNDNIYPRRAGKPKKDPL